MGSDSAIGGADPFEFLLRWAGVASTDTRLNLHVRALPASRFLSRRSSFKMKQGFMTIEQAIAHSLSKPWGVVDPRPWSSAGRDDNTIGEIWYERSGAAAAAPALLLKLLF